MNTDEFFTRVRDRAGLVDLEDAQRACEVEFQILRARLTHAIGDRIADELPINMKSMWESGLLAHLTRSISSAEEFNMLEFLDRVREEARLQTRDQAVIVTQAVFATLSEQISHPVKRDMVRELPNDIHEFWQSSSKIEEEGAVYAAAHGQVHEPQPEPEIIPTTESYWETPSSQEAMALPMEAQAHEDTIQGSQTDLPEGQYGSDKIGPSAAEVYRSDQQIKNEIEELLDANDEVDVRDINVSVQQGRVILAGSVESLSQKSAAERIASNALGTTEIDNELQVEQQRS